MVSGLIKKSFNALNENPTITLFLVLFLIVTNFFAPYIFTAQSRITAFILMICIFLLSSIFLSGWFQILKESTDTTKAKEKNFPAIFFEGVGKNLIPVAIAFFLYSTLLSLALYFTSKFANEFFGSLDFILSDFRSIASDNNALVEYVKNLPTEKLYIIYGWQISLIIASVVYNFLFLFLFPAIICDTKTNPFLKVITAFKSSMCFIYKNFLQVLAIYVLICTIYMFLGILKAMFGMHIIFSILLLLAYIYFVSWAIMLIFNYYEQKSCCNHGSDCIGEDENCDSVSKED